MQVNVVPMWWSVAVVNLRLFPEVFSAVANMHVFSNCEEKLHFGEKWQIRGVAEKEVVALAVASAGMATIKF